MYPKRSLPKLMWWLGYGGLVPFFALTVALLLGSGLPCWKTCGWIGGWQRMRRLS